ncbi:putative ATP-dependent serine protease [Arthrobacter bambusae]|nr:putative ATP-dependent serine protease [Arthrobacter bambusae]
MNPVCTCGTTKDVVHLVALCSHCDDNQCKGMAGGCDRCARYNAVANYRATKEYEREKNHG